MNYKLLILILFLGIVRVSFGETTEELETQYRAAAGNSPMTSELVTCASTLRGCQKQCSDVTCIENCYAAYTNCASNAPQLPESFQ